MRKVCLRSRLPPIAGSPTATRKVIIFTINTVKRHEVKQPNVITEIPALRKLCPEHVDRRCSPSEDGHPTQHPRACPGGGGCRGPHAAGERPVHRCHHRPLASGGFEGLARGAGPALDLEHVRTCGSDSPRFTLCLILSRIPASPPFNSAVCDASVLGKGHVSAFAPRSQGTRSESPGGCLQPQVAPDPIATVLFPFSA